MSQIQFNIVIPQMPDYPLDWLENQEFGWVPRLYSSGEYIWGYLTYRILKEIGFPLRLSFDISPDAINLSHGNVLRSLKMRPDCFCVSLQADFPHFPLAHYHIVQNQYQITKNASYVPHWPQPNQKPRDGARTGVRRVAYQGARNFTALEEKRLNSDLQKHGISFEILDEEEWSNLQSVDVLLGIRSFGKKRYKRKPPTKLINAWHAGIPFIGGWDSAYAQIGSPGEDYLRVASYQEMLDCIVMLKDDLQLYNNLVMSGKRRSAEFTFESIAQHWKSLLESEITRAYFKWKRKPGKRVRHDAKMIRHKINYTIRQTVQKGYRIPALKLLRDRYYDPVK